MVHIAPRPAKLLVQRHALSLLELVVALGILAVLAGIAVRSLEPIADQARFDTTEQLLIDVRMATIGDEQLRDSSGALMPTGILADCGHLPSAVDSFYTNPPSLSAWSVQHFDSDGDSVNDLSLSSGWNGPYLQPPLGQSTPASLEDGWGQPLLMNVPISGTLELGSLGSDATSGGVGYAEDLALTIVPNDYLGSIVCRLYDIDGTTGARIDPSVTGTEKMLVRFYGVNAAGGLTGTIETVPQIVASSGSFDTRFSGRLHGSAAARALVWDDTNNDNIFDGSESVIRRSRVHYFTVLAGREQRIEMELR